MKTLIRPINHLVLSRIINFVTLITEESLILFDYDHDWEDRGGAYFCLADGETGIPLIVLPVGNSGIRFEKAEKYIELCLEKAKRLSQNRNDISSWASRNLTARQYGGAIRFEGLIFSMSGFPEMGDEAIMLATAGATFLSLKRSNTIDYLDSIANINANKYWPKLKGYILNSF